MTGTPDDDEHDMQAAEYVMGALPPQQARALEALALTDTAVAASIAAWEHRLGPLADLVPPVPPPEMVWRRLALATEKTPGTSPAMATGRVIPFARPSAAVRAWQSPVLWRTLTAGAMAVAASLAILLVRPAPAPLIAALSPIGQPGATFLVRVGADGSAAVIAVGNTAVPPGRALELWALAPGSTTPVSLGLLPGTGRAELALHVPSGTQLLVSQEQAGGSPTKAPTTAPILAGQLTGT